jgi:hypothetical protein
MTDYTAKITKIKNTIEDIRGDIHLMKTVIFSLLNINRKTKKSSMV